MIISDRIEVWLFLNHGWLSWIYYVIVCFILGVLLYYAILNVVEALESKGIMFRKKTSELVLIVLLKINDILAKMSKRK
jgi:predicted PurR-regulated permease PerM